MGPGGLPGHCVLRSDRFGRAEGPSSGRFPHPDRFAVIVLVLAWLWFGGDQRAVLRTRRSGLLVTATCVFLALAVASLLLDAGRIIDLSDFQLAEKHFARLGSFLVPARGSRSPRCGLRMCAGFAELSDRAGALMSIGMLVERRTGYNVFYELEPRDSRADRQRRGVADRHSPGVRLRRSGHCRGPHEAIPSPLRRCS